MSRAKISRNAPCPCGSGRKYKVCCWQKGYTFERGGDGGVDRVIPLPDEALDILKAQKKKFIDTFGREPGPQDPVFFDAPPQEEIEEAMLAAMEAAGIDPAFAYAYKKTGGLLVTEENRQLISNNDLLAWDAAIEEYDQLHRGRAKKPD